MTFKVEQVYGAQEEGQNMIKRSFFKYHIMMGYYCTIFIFRICIQYSSVQCWLLKHFNMFLPTTASS